MFCQVCDSENVDRWDELSLVVCRDCGYKASTEPYANPYLENKALTDKFIELDKTPIAERLTDIRISHLRKFCSLDGSVLDLGCSVGTFIDKARREGFMASGVECSPWAVSYALDKGLSVRQAWLDEVDSLDFKRFHAVTMFDVIEHLFSLYHVIRFANEVLFENGVIIVSTPDCEGVSRQDFSRWRHYRPGEHYHYFTLKSLITLLESSGFKVLWFSHDESVVRVDPERPLKNILTVIAKKES